MKRIEFIAPVESMRGNLSGKQELKYAENENPAYEAPNGSQSAHNYQPRFIGAKRAASGLKYYAVRTKQTAVLNGKTRLQMALTGTIAAIRSAVMALPAAGSGRKPWDTIIAAYDKYKAENPGEKDAKSLQAYFDARVRDMLRYKRASVTFTAVVGGWVLNNPFKLDNNSALTISQSIWSKFAIQFAFTATSGQTANRVVEFSIDSVKFINPDYSKDFGTIKGAIANSYCPNLATQWGSITMASSAIDSAILFRELPVYTEAGVAVIGETEPQDSKFTTVDPDA